MSNSKGVKLWETAKHLIPGGNQLLSKRSEMFLPNIWPSYYEKAKGCEVWDLDGEKYFDFAGMGVGACILGYADEDVNEAVVKAVQKGSMCSLNCPEEVELSKVLLDTHPWAGMVRYARTGGEACAIAVRIARAASKKDKVAFCGYHGWHDWYLSANLSNSRNLDGQLLPGLKPSGVPRGLIGTMLPFNYGSTDELERLIKQHSDEIGVIIMEPVRDKADVEFLKEVRAIATRMGAVLIFDEVTTGFRMNFGGVHLDFGVEPDMAIFGKALGNGFPISAVVGKKNIMDAAQTSFISSTLWTEKTGYVAALATLKKIKEINATNILNENGSKIQEGWLRNSKTVGLDVHVGGPNPMTHVSFKYDNGLSIQTYYTQEMLKRGFLASASPFATCCYTDEIIKSYIEHSQAVFDEIKKAIDENSLERKLEGPVKHDGFRRLT